jgi:hypothetical protein
MPEMYGGPGRNLSPLIDHYRRALIARGCPEHTARDRAFRKARRNQHLAPRIGERFVPPSMSNATQGPRPATGEDS